MDYKIFVLLKIHFGQVCRCIGHTKEIRKDSTIKPKTFDLSKSSSSMINNICQDNSLNIFTNKHESISI